MKTITKLQALRKIKNNKNFKETALKNNGWWIDPDKFQVKIIESKKEIIIIADSSQNGISGSQYIYNTLSKEWEEISYKEHGIYYSPKYKNFSEDWEYEDYSNKLILNKKNSKITHKTIFIR